MHAVLTKTAELSIAHRWRHVLPCVQGGVLYVRITKAVHLIHKPVYKGNFTGSLT